MVWICGLYSRQEITCYWENLYDNGCLKDSECWRMDIGEQVVTKADEITWLRSVTNVGP
jgi:hypothetical protein